MTRAEGGKRRMRPLPQPGRYAHIVGWGIKVPERVVTNLDLEQIVETSDAWIRERTGIAERRIAADRESAVSLGVGAAREALARASLLPQDIDQIIVATSSPEYLFPATACLIQDRLGATRAGAFDVLAACTGFIYALGLAAAEIQSGAIETALVIGTETLSRIVDWSDRSTCVLFGDGAGAFVLRAADTPGGVRHYVLHSDGSGGDYLSARSGVRDTWRGPALAQSIVMNGREVFRFAARVMVQATQEVLEQAGLAITDIDLIVPHQANLRIIQAAARGLDLPEERFFINIDHFGNTSTASIPLAVAEAVEKGCLKPNDRIVVVGFGAGLTWGAALLEWAVEPTPRSYLREVLREGWYILARVRSLFRRMLRVIEAVLWPSSIGRSAKSTAPGRSGSKKQ